MEETSCRSPCPIGPARAAAKRRRGQNQPLRGKRRFSLPGPTRPPAARAALGRGCKVLGRQTALKRDRLSRSSPCGHGLRTGRPPVPRRFLFGSSPFCLRPTLRCFRAARRCRRQSACLKRADAAVKPPPQRTMLPTHLPVDRLPSPPPHAPYRPRSGACGPAQCSLRGKGLPAYGFSPLPAPAMRKFSACPCKAGEGASAPANKKDQPGRSLKTRRADLSALPCIFAGALFCRVPLCKVNAAADNARRSRRRSPRRWAAPTRPGSCPGYASHRHGPPPCCPPPNAGTRTAPARQWL